jgi:hypothetical protein
MKMTEDELKAMLATDSLPCTVCKGTGKRIDWKGQEKACYACEGAGMFQNPMKEKDAILSACKGRGERLRSSRPPYAKGARAYYVWRLARFHGGIDVRLPMMAGLDVHGDPYVDILDLMADAVAQRFCGTDMAAAYRWGLAMGSVNEIPKGLPATAYPGGPEVIR